MINMQVIFDTNNNLMFVICFVLGPCTFSILLLETLSTSIIELFACAKASLFN